MDAKEDDAMLRGQVAIWHCMFGFADAMALTCAVELGIANIMHSHGRPVTLHQIGASIDGTSSPDIPSLARIMRLLVRREIFAAHQPSDGGDTLYGQTYSSRWLVTESGSESNLAPMGGFVRITRIRVTRRLECKRNVRLEQAPVVFDVRTSK
ncbi:hypothetical protein CRG98_043502 [Punica granatum]|uniref:O-methyltransferase dimerisation domain-containing protein n=1 Tax=Punica granatum TaxID=22663 RepID=A0A2I0HX53_PUNGR|nr:hypothetical protein CRG98_043502 [Punica granatum]